jgi:hypothetical protein
MSDTVRVRAIAPVDYTDPATGKTTRYEPGNDWEAVRDLVQGLLEMSGQLEEVVEPSLLIVPSIGLYLPSENQPAPPVIKGKNPAN